LLVMQARTLVFDCGTGRTRAKVFTQWRDKMEIVEAGKHCKADEAWAAATIAATLQGDEETITTWIEELRALAQKCSCDRAIVGATAGLRQAISQGDVQQSAVTALDVRMAKLSPPLTFHLLQKEDEAARELKAVQYVASLCLPDAPKPVSMLSGGSGSCQIAYYPASAPRFISLDTGMRGASDAMVEGDGKTCSIASGALQVLDDFEKKLADLVRGTNLCGTLRDTVCVIEMLGYLGESQSHMPELAKLGLGGKLRKKNDVVDVLRKQVAAWRADVEKQIPRKVYDKYNVCYDDVYGGLLPACLLGLLELVDAEKAQLYICREWEISPGCKIKPDWSLGMCFEEEEPAAKSAFDTGLNCCSY